MLRLLTDRVGLRRCSGCARPNPRSDEGSGAGLHAPVLPEGDRGTADLRALLGGGARLAAYYRLGSGDAVVRRAADAGSGDAAGVRVAMRVFPETRVDRS